MKNRIIKVIGNGCKYANITGQGMGLMCLTNLPEMCHKILFQDKEYNLSKTSASIYNLKVCYPHLFGDISINYGYNIIRNRFKKVVDNGQLNSIHVEALLKENLIIDYLSTFNKEKPVKSLNQWK